MIDILAIIVAVIGLIFGKLKFSKTRTTIPTATRTVSVLVLLIMYHSLILGPHGMQGLGSLVLMIIVCGIFSTEDVQQIKAPTEEITDEEEQEAFLYMAGRVIRGPVSLDKMQRLITIGTVDGYTPVRKIGEPEWTEAGLHEELFN